LRELRRQQRGQRGILGQQQKASRRHVETAPFPTESPPARRDHTPMGRTMRQDEENFIRPPWQSASARHIPKELCLKRRRECPLT
jgi:hypothetical protein